MMELECASFFSALSISFFRHLQQYFHQCMEIINSLLLKGNLLLLLGQLMCNFIRGSNHANRGIPFVKGAGNE